MPPESAAMRLIAPVLLAIALAGCASTPPAPRAEPDPGPPDYRKLIADNLKTLFSPDAQVRNVMVSELSQVPSPAGLMWGTCVRLNATGMSGRPTAPRTYVVTFSRGAIADRRAVAGQDCVGAKFERLG
jgi:hypothetical protein